MTHGEMDRAKTIKVTHGGMGRVEDTKSNDPWGDGKSRGYRGDHKHSNIASDVDQDESHRTAELLDEDDHESLQFPNPEKVQVSVRKLLAAWRGVSARKEREAWKSQDGKVQKLMHSTQMIIEMIQNDMEVNSAGRVLGIAFGEASDDNIQALASVSLRWEHDQYGSLSKIAREQGLKLPNLLAVPVVYIDGLVTTPNEKQKGAGGHLINCITSWAKDKRRLVTLTPANQQLKEYYQSLGCKLIDRFSDMMVCGANQEQGAPSEGILFDLGQLGQSRK